MRRAPTRPSPRPSRRRPAARPAPAGRRRRPRRSTSPAAGRGRRPASRLGDQRRHGADVLPLVRPGRELHAGCAEAARHYSKLRSPLLVEHAPEGDEQATNRIAACSTAMRSPPAAGRSSAETPHSLACRVEAVDLALREGEQQRQRRRQEERRGQEGELARRAHPPRRDHGPPEDDPCRQQQHVLDAQRPAVAERVVVEGGNVQRRTRPPARPAGRRPAWWRSRPAAGARRRAASPASARAPGAAAPSRRASRSGAGGS